MFDIRFNKGRGKYFKYWRIQERSDGKVSYIDPKIFAISMFDCILINKKTIAKKVFATQKRNVCGFVRCKKYKILKRCYCKVDELEELLYDPKIAPFWRKNNRSNSLDGSKYEKLTTKGRRIFVVD